MAGWEKQVYRNPAVSWVKPKGLLNYDQTEPGLEAPMFSPDDLIGSGVGKGLLAVGTGVAGLLGMMARGGAPKSVMVKYSPKQTGMIGWHGSPHKFDKFSLEKIGTGEGAQAYGHGSYIAEAKDVAKTYTGAGKTVGGESAESKLLKQMEKAQDAGRYGEAAAIEELLVNRNPALAKTKISIENGYSAETVKQAHAAIDKLQEKFIPGQLYKTDIPDEAVAKFLDWDKPLSQQAPEVKDAFNKFVDSPEGVALAEQYYSYKPGMKLSDLPEWKDPQGETLYKNAFGGWENANNALAMNGVKGIRYLDGDSRGYHVDLMLKDKLYATNKFDSLSAAEQYAAEKAAEGFTPKLDMRGTSNFVIFDPEMIRILERNGIPTGQSPWSPGEWGGLLGGNK